MAQYLSPLVQKMHAEPQPFSAQTGASPNLFISQNHLQGELAARETCALGFALVHRLTTQAGIPFHPIRSLGCSEDSWGWVWDREHLSLQSLEGLKETTWGAAECRSPQGSFLAGGEESSAAPQPYSQFVNVINLEVLLLPQVQLTSPSANP